MRSSRSPRFNGYARKGVDPEFGRGKYLYDREWHLLFSARRADTTQPANPAPNNTMHPFAAKSPYYALALGPGTLDANGFTEEEFAPALSLFGRIGKPEEIAEASAWLCSDASSYVTSHSLAVEGGYLTR